IYYNIYIPDIIMNCVCMGFVCDNGLVNIDILENFEIYMTCENFMKMITCKCYDEEYRCENCSMLEKKYVCNYCQGDLCENTGYIFESNITCREHYRLITCQVCNRFDPTCESCL